MIYKFANFSFLLIKETFRLKKIILFVELSKYKIYISKITENFLQDPMQLVFILRAYFRQSEKLLSINLSSKFKWDKTLHNKYVYTKVYFIKFLYLLQKLYKAKTRSLGKTEKKFILFCKITSLILQHLVRHIDELILVKNVLKDQSL